MARTMTCPHCSKSFEVEGTGVTAEIRSFAKLYLSTHPTAKVSEVAKAYIRQAEKAGTEWNMNTVNTQVRAVVS